MDGRLITKVVENGGDTIGAALVVGVWGELVPVVLGLLGIAWFVLRFVNFIRVNVFDKSTWGMK